MSPLFHVLLALAAVIVVGRLLGAACQFIGQPSVIGEILAGIVLGPSLLGRLWPAATSFLLPANVEPFLAIMAELGIVLYMFLVGLELDFGKVRGRGRATLVISHASMLGPMLLAALLAWWLYPAYAGSQARFDSFALFLGVAMSITAFPVLARILTDLGLQRTPLGAWH